MINYKDLNAMLNKVRNDILQIILGLINSLEKEEIKNKI